MTATSHAPYRPWVKMRRKPAPPARGGADTAAWVYLASGGSGREHVTAPVDRMVVPQGCDQCAQLISPAAIDGARSFKVQRGLSPTTLYICAGCVTDLCAVSDVPSPEPGS